MSSKCTTVPIPLSLLLCSLLSPLLLLCVFQFLRYLFTFFHYYYSYSVVSVSVSTSSPSPHPVFSILFVVVIISKALTYLSSFRFVAYPLHTGYTNCVGETHLKGIPKCEREKERDLYCPRLSLHTQSFIIINLYWNLFCVGWSTLICHLFQGYFIFVPLSIVSLCLCVFIFEFICLLSFRFVSFLHFLLGHLIIIQIFYLDTHSDLSSSHSYRAITTTTTSTLTHTRVWSSFVLLSGLGSVGFPFGVCV